MSKQPYERVNWESGTLVTPAKVLADNTIQDAVYDCDTPLTPENLNKMDSGIKTLDDNKIEIIELLTVSDVAPTECATGDMYYNTTTNKIYTATNTNTWGETGADPESNNLYIDLENTNIYYYDGTSFKSYGGGSGSGGDTEPIGSTKMYFGTTEPTGYKFVNGQALSRTEYAELFNLIGTTYGAGDESTTFNLPDMSGRVPVGLNVNKEWFNQLGKTGGSEEVTLTIEQIPNHTHSVNLSSGDETGINKLTTSSWSWSTQNQQNNGLLNPTGGGQAHTNLQPYITVNYIMKVKNVASENVIVPDNFPIGGEISYSANTLPDSSWVWSDTNYLISDYPELAALYDGIFDDETTQEGYFKTPKKAGLVTVGLDPDDTDFNTIGKTAGEKEHQLTVDELPKMGLTTGHFSYSDSLWSGTNITHEHLSGQGTSGTNDQAERANVNNGAQHKYSWGNNESHNNIQPSIVSRFIIKAKRIEPNMSTVIGANDTPNDKDVYSSNATKQLINNSLNKVLWTNSNPSAGMAADTLINLNSSDYDEIRWIFCYSGADSNVNSSLSCLKGNSVNLFAIGYASNGTVRRILDYVSDTQYKARVAYNGSEQSANHCVPLYAIGIKYGDSNG